MSTALRRPAEETQMRPSIPLAMIGLAAILTACNAPASGPAEAPAGGKTEAAASTATPSVPADVVEAVKCWGLVQGAYTYHLAMPELAGDLPKATGEQKTAWFNEALRRADKAGMNQSQFKALQDEYQMSNRFAVARVREASIEPVKACMAATPPNPSEPPQLRQG
jgi:hypothetical protein